MSEEIKAELLAHEEDTNNPHEVTKEQIGLGSVENIAPENMPISADTQAALDLKASEHDLAMEKMDRATADLNLDRRVVALEEDVPGYITKDVDNLIHYYNIDTTDNLLEQKQDCIEDITNGDIDNLF